MTGLVARIGQLGLATGFPEPYAEVLASPDAAERSLPDREREAFGATHLELSEQILEKWRFPCEIVAAVGSTSHSLRRTRSGRFGGSGPARGRPRRRGDSARSTKARRHQLVCVTTPVVFSRSTRSPGVALFEASVEEWHEIGALFEVATRRIPSLAEIEEDAREQLALLSLSLQNQHRDLHRQARIDPLTGVSNRSVLDERFELEINRASARNVRLPC